MLIAKQIKKNYGSLSVLKGVDLQLEAGKVAALVGSSGAGKSTLLQILGTLDTADSGEIYFDEQAVHGFSSSEKAAFRNLNLGFVFQFHHLLPEFTALENVSMPAWVAKRPEKEVLEDATAILQRLGLGDRLHHKPSELSGGEQQRVSVARALVNRPRWVLADEPTGNLDTANSENLYELFVELAREWNIGFLIATHNEALAQKSDLILHIQDGKMRDA